MSEDREIKTMGEEHVEVTCTQGILRGLVKTSTGTLSTSYCSFQGIPYAKPPVGPLRFQAPVPFGSWEGVREAVKEGNDSLQHHMLFKYLTGDEDCLYLNVYTPQVGNTEKKAVMVWIHGGGYARGSGSTELYGPDFLIEHDIVLVTINYRCGILGFLSLENEQITGNFGLKDQNLALRWVQDNISSFGGDPNNVTIFGESAGAASVHCHILSPTSAGLFHKAILQSGSSVCQLAFQHKPRDKALRVARELGCTSDDLDEVSQFLMTVPASDIIEVQDRESVPNAKEVVQMFALMYLPCVEVAGDAPFLSESPRKLLETGDYNKVPVIMGATNKEGMLALYLKEVQINLVNKDVSLMVPFDVNVPERSSEELKLGQEILKYYTKSETVSWENMEHFLDFMSDIGFIIGINNTRESMLNHSAPEYPVYTYLFTYSSTRSLSSLMLPTTFPEKADELRSYGVCHGDEMVHQFRSNLSQIPYIAPSDQDREFMVKFLKAWTTFAKTGNPNCAELGRTWEADDLKNPHYFELGANPKSVNDVIFQQRMAFWKDIYQKYSRRE